MEWHANIAVRARCELGEGPMWDGTRLHWVDIACGRLHRWRPGDEGHETLELGGFVSAVAPHRDGGLVVTRQHTIEHLDWDSGRTQEMARLPDCDPDQRINDAKCDPAGRLWFGTLSLQGRVGTQNLFCVQDDGPPRTMLEGVSLANGLGWSPDARQMYFVDSKARRLDVFGFDLSTGRIEGRRTLRDFENATPDGLAVDQRGGLWVAVWDGARIEQIDPSSGEVVGAVRVPTRRPTSCCFAGTTLYITSAAQGTGEDDSDAGGVFAARVNTSATGASAFASA